MTEQERKQVAQRMRIMLQKYLETRSRFMMSKQTDIDYRTICSFFKKEHIVPEACTLLKIRNYLIELGEKEQDLDFVLGLDKPLLYPHIYHDLVYMLAKDPVHFSKLSKKINLNITTLYSFLRSEKKISPSSLLKIKNFLTNNQKV